MQQTDKYDSSKDTVVNLLLHYVTSCDVTLSESQRQAFLALHRKDTQKSNPEE